MRFLDPAIGCGNFLVITYRELRLLELDVLRALHTDKQVAIDISSVALLDVDMMHGIEIEEFPARIAEVAMWLIDHQMNMLMSMEFGQYYARLPLKKSAHIVNGNALRLDWNEVVNKNELSYILGNPPFIGKHLQNQEQKHDMALLFDKIKGYGVLDYVCAWYVKASDFVYGTIIKVAFVSTNSISQGEQVGTLWDLLFNRFNVKIHFAHRSFVWKNEAKGNAAVHVIVVGFACYDVSDKFLIDYKQMQTETVSSRVRNINPYLTEGKDFALLPRENSICDVPKVTWGNKPVDGGNLILSNNELSELLSKEPQAKKHIKPLICAKEFLKGEKRWCLWLVNAEPKELKEMPLVLERIRNVKKMREGSVDKGARLLAQKPTLFRDTKNPESYILIPSTTSENRSYIPFAFFDSESIPHNSCHILPNGKLFHFGVLTSTMHMAWVRTVCGRLKSDFRYSKDIVYNNYPWPENPSDKQKEAIEQAAQKVLDTRKEFPNSSLADLYDPLTMPPSLVKAHQELDKVVDLAYRPQPFPSEAKRMEFLFELYEKYTANLFTKEKVKAPKKRTGKAKE